MKLLYFVKKLGSVSSNNSGHKSIISTIYLTLYLFMYCRMLFEMKIAGSLKIIKSGVLFDSKCLITFIIKSFSYKILENEICDLYLKPFIIKYSIPF